MSISLLQESSEHCTHRGLERGLRGCRVHTLGRHCKMCTKEQASMHASSEGVGERDCIAGMEGNVKIREIELESGPRQESMTIATRKMKSNFRSRVLFLVLSLIFCSCS